jgi:hypothetical protein
VGKGNRAGTYSGGRETEWGGRERDQAGGIGNSREEGERRWKEELVKSRYGRAEAPQRARQEGCGTEHRSVQLILDYAGAEIIIFFFLKKISDYTERCMQEKMY